jgi:cyclic pyranopterin monophosphate synthase
MDRQVKRLTHVDAKGHARMVDVGGKAQTERTAVASARVEISDTLKALIASGGLPKGDVLGVARVAGIMAAKKTAELIPLCHPLTLDAVTVDLTLDASGVTIRATVKTSGPTGVEMEAMTAVSVAALAFYDMCKSIDRGMVITRVQLEEKRGGKSDAFTRERKPAEAVAAPRAVVRTSSTPGSRRFAVITLSDRAAVGTRADESGVIAETILTSLLGAGLVSREVLPDDADLLAARLIALADDEACDLIVTTGGTGLSPRDVTPEATKAVIDREVPGIAEAIRAGGLAKTPYAMLSRAVCGQRGATLIVNLSGSPKAVREQLEILGPVLGHVLTTASGAPQDCGRSG